MEQVITLIVVWFIVNVLAAFRFALFSNMNKKMVVFSLIMMNLILVGIYIIYRIGFENVNKSVLIAIVVIIAVFFYYKQHDDK